MNGAVTEHRTWSRLFQTLRTDPCQFLENKIRPILLDAKSLLRVCSFVQFLSKCLKLSRKSSHPERAIGRKLKADESIHLKDSIISTKDGAVEDNYVRQIAKLVSAAVEALIPELFTIIKLSSLHYSYFGLILIKDVMKERLAAKSCELPEIYVNGMTLCVLRELSSIINCRKDIMKYYPSSVKVFDIIHLIISEPYLERYMFTGTEVEIFQQLSVLLDNLWKDLENCREESSADTSRQISSPQLCNIISCDISSDETSASQWTASCILVINEMLRYCSVHPISVPDVDISDARNSILQVPADIANVRSVLVSLTRYLDKELFRTSSETMLQALSGNDATLFKFLLSVVEINLRINILISNQQDSRDSIYFELSVCLIKYRFEPLVMFICLIQNILCMDTSVLIDLISNPETVALKYTLRILKYLIGHLSENSVPNEESSSMQSTHYDTYSSGKTDYIVILEFVTEFRYKVRKLNDLNILPFNGDKLITCLSTLILLLNQSIG